MPETPKKKPESAECDTEDPKEDSWTEDQKNREYYYDDAHGYEVYTPDEDDDETRTE